MIVARHTLQLGALLTILGAGTFALMAGFMPGAWSALRPALFGVVFLGIGLLALKRASCQRPLVHVAVGFALFVGLGTLPGLVKAIALLGGNEVADPAAALQQAFTALACFGFVGRAAPFLFIARR